MTQNEDIQDELLQEQQLRILAATLDVTHDPVRWYLKLLKFKISTFFFKLYFGVRDNFVGVLIFTYMPPSIKLCDFCHFENK